MWEHSFVRDLTEKEVEDLLEKTEFNGWEIGNSHRYTGFYNSTPKYSLFFKRQIKEQVSKNFVDFGK